MRRLCCQTIGANRTEKARQVGDIVERIERRVGLRGLAVRSPPQKKKTMNFLISKCLAAFRGAKFNIFVAITRGTGTRVTNIGCHFVVTSPLNTNPIEAIACTCVSNVLKGSVLRQS